MDKFDYFISGWGAAASAGLIISVPRDPTLIGFALLAFNAFVAIAPWVKRKRGA